MPDHSKHELHELIAPVSALLVPIFFVLVRRVFKEGSGVPNVVAVHQDATGKAMALALAWALYELGSDAAQLARAREAARTGDDEGH